MGHTRTGQTSSEWQDDFIIGVASIDREHRDMIDMINELHTQLSASPPVDTVMSFLGEIHAGIAMHFALEEKLMRADKYDQYEDHKRDHERLLDEIRDIMDQYEDSQYFDEQRLAQELTQWFMVHFKTKDARLHKHLG